jgi:hypothetical protein
MKIHEKIFPVNARNLQKSKTVRLAEKAKLKDYFYISSNVYKNEELRLAAKELSSNLTLAIDQLRETILRVIPEVGEFNAPGLYEAFENDLREGINDIRDAFNVAYKKIKMKKKSY